MGRLNYLIEFQLDDLNTKGYSFLHKKQLGMIYGKESPLNISHLAKFDFDAIDQMTEAEREITLQNFVTQLAGSKGIEARYKDDNDIVLTPVVLNSPFSFINSPAANSDVVLSPLVLSPVISSPLGTIDTSAV